jgi:release factor glutamine methyltransferase
MREFLVKPPILIPRPETEELVDRIVADLLHAGFTNKSKLRFMDLCCGSGAIGIAILRSFPESTCLAVDKNPLAAQLTRENARKFHVIDRIESIECDLNTMELGHFDFIVSNPPYIPSSNLERLQPEIRKWEDPSAVDGGIEGMNLISIIVNKFVLSETPVLWLETETHHCNLIKAMVVEEPCKVECFDDFRGNHRFVKITRNL